MASSRRWPGSGRRAIARRRVRMSGEEQAALLFLLLAVVWDLLVSALRWLAANPWVPGGLLVGALAVAGVWVRRRREAARWSRARERGLRYDLPRIDALHHRRLRKRCEI